MTVSPALKDLISANKEKWSVDKEALNKRISFAKSKYMNNLPKVGECKFKRVRKYFQTLQLMVEGVRGEFSEYEIEYKFCSNRGGFEIMFIKPFDQIEQDLQVLEKDITSIYKDELKEIKQNWVVTLTKELSEAEEHKALIIAQEKAKTVQEELLKMIG